MRIVLAVLLTLSSTIIAQADEPAAPASTTATAPAATPPPATAATSTPADPKAELEAKKQAAMAELKKNGFSGYKTKIDKNGNATYCRKEQQIGSRFEIENCRSLQDLLAQREAGKSYLNTVQQQGLEGRASN
jgi:hypothetical protein